MEIKFPNISKAVLILSISLLSLGLGEFHELGTLMVFGFILSALSCISVLLVLIAYTIDFWRKNVNKNS